MGTLADEPPPPLRISRALTTDLVNSSPPLTADRHFSHNYSGSAFRTGFRHAGEAGGGSHVFPLLSLNHTTRALKEFFYIV